MASYEPSVYAGSGIRFLKTRVDTGLLLSGLRDSILWYGRISRLADSQISRLADQQHPKTIDGLEDEL